jgi:hypothetical protein
LTYSTTISCVARLTIRHCVAYLVEIACSYYIELVIAGHLCVIKADTAWTGCQYFRQNQYWVITACAIIAIVTEMFNTARHRSFYLLMVSYAFAVYWVRWKANIENPRKYFDCLVLPRCNDKWGRGV